MDDASRPHSPRDGAEPASPPLWPRDAVRHWLSRCAGDDELCCLARAADVRFGFRATHDPAAAAPGGASDELFSIPFRDGTVVPDDTGPATDGTGGSAPATTDDAVRELSFTVSASVAAWREFFSPQPRSPYHGVFAMLMREPSAHVEGEELAFAQHAHLVRRVLEIGREVLSGWRRPGAPDATAAPRTPAVPEPPTVPEPPAGEHITGRYLAIPVAGSDCRIFYEEAGEGHPLVMLHTAGADSRQYHHLMNHPRLRQRYRMVAFDLPWHGRSGPIGGQPPGAYALDTDLYASTVMAVIDALGLVDPVVIGSSMGGEICLELAYRHPDRLAGVVACEASDQVPGRQTPWARHPKVNQTLFVPEWVDNLMSPSSPDRYRREVWWTYSQGGYGTFHGDISFYSGDWDARDRVADIDTGRCKVVMLTGEYDYSCTPAMSEATAAKIPGAVYRTMPGLGHFPMAENPPVFADHLLRALDEIGVAAGPLSEDTAIPSGVRA